MDSFLDFLTDNYTYFLIAAGVLLLALIGLIVSGRNKKKKEENVDFEETPVDNTVVASEQPTAVGETPVSAPTLSATPEPVAPVKPQEPAPETINLATPVEAPAPVESVQPSPTDFNNNVSVPPTGSVQTPDDSIVQINPVENNTFNANQNNTNNTL